MESQKHPGEDFLNRAEDAAEWHPGTDTMGQATRILGENEQVMVGGVMRLVWALENQMEDGEFIGDFAWVNELPPTVKARIAELVGTAYRLFEGGSAWAEFEAFVNANVPGAFRAKNDFLDADCYPG